MATHNKASGRQLSSSRLQVMIVDLHNVRSLHSISLSKSTLNVVESSAYGRIRGPNIGAIMTRGSSGGKFYQQWQMWRLCTSAPLNFPHTPSRWTSYGPSHEECHRPHVPQTFCYSKSTITSALKYSLPLQDRLQKNNHRNHMQVSP